MFCDVCQPLISMLQFASRLQFCDTTDALRWKWCRDVCALSCPIMVWEQNATHLQLAGAGKRYEDYNQHRIIWQNKSARSNLDLNQFTFDHINISVLGHFRNNFLSMPSINIAGLLSVYILQQYNSLQSFT